MRASVALAITAIVCWAVIFLIKGAVPDAFTVIAGGLATAAGVEAHKDNQVAREIKMRLSK